MSMFLFCVFRACNDAAHLRFMCGDPKVCLLGFLKMLVLALPQIYTRVFHLCNTVDLQSVWVGDSCPYQLPFLPRVLARLTMRHTRVFDVGIPNYAYLTF